MNKLFLLLKIRFDEWFGISATKYEKNPGKRNLKYIRYVVAILLTLICVGLSFGVSMKLAESGFAKMLPVTAYALGSIISLVVTILKINEMISGNEDAEFLMSMPFSSVVQVIVMFLMLYLKNTFYTMIVAVPMGLVYGRYTSVSGGFWGLWILGLLLTSLPTSGIAALIGMVIAILLSTSKNSNLIQSLVSLGILTGVFLLVIHLVDGVGKILERGTGRNTGELCEKIIAEITGNYKLAGFYQNGIVNQSALWVFLFVLMSVIWYLFFVFFLSISYQELILALQSPVNYQVYEFRPLVQRDLGKTLYLREVEQWLHSKSYMVNSMIGVLLSLVVSLVLLVKGVEPVCQRFGVLEYLPEITRCVPALLCLTVGMSCTSYCSMSLEGKRHWILETMPIDEKIICRSKVRLNLTITIPSVVVSALFLSLAFHTSVFRTLLFFLIPLSYAFLSAWWGIWIDQKYGDYASESENQAMHQSPVFFLGYLPGVLLPLAAMIFLLKG